LIIYGDVPEDDDDRVIRIDLVYIVDPDDMTGKKRYNKVRLQGKTWGDIQGKMKTKKEEKADKEDTTNNIDDDDKEDVNTINFKRGMKLGKSVDEIREFCMQYETNNPIYSYIDNNCRKFMLAIAHYIGAVFPDTFPCEEFWYSVRDASQLVKKSVN